MHDGNRKKDESNYFHWDSGERRGNGLTSKQFNQTSERPATPLKHLLLQSLSVMGSKQAQIMSLHNAVQTSDTGRCRKHEPMINSDHNKLCLKPYWLYYIDCLCGMFILCRKTTSVQPLETEAATHWDLLTSPLLWQHRKQTLFSGGFQKLAKGGKIWCVCSVAPDERLFCLNTEPKNQTVFL